MTDLTPADRRPPSRWEVVRWWLPRSTMLPTATWRHRHRAVIVLLAVQALTFAVWSTVGHRSVLERGAIVGVPLAAAVLAGSDRIGRRVRSCIGAAGLVLAAAIVVRLSDGLTESHFLFFVMIPVVALYEDWAPFGIAVAIVLLHHGVVGTLDPRLVYDHAAAWHHPWRYAFLHSAFFAAACAGSMINWRLQQLSREQQVRLTERLEHQANHDSLTGLPNRARLRQVGTDLLEHGHATSGVAVLLVDLDDFKTINDTLGHTSGDVLLARLGPLLASVVRPGDVIARLGGDEFAAVLADADERAAIAVARRIIDLVAQPIVIDGVRLRVGASVGVAVDPCTNDIDALLRKADVAMYTAKRARIGFAVYRPDQETSSRSQLSLLGELRRAIDENEIVLHFQPKLALDDRRIVGVEALARWQHPTRGLLSPAAFLPAVESSSLVVPFALHVLDRALAQAAAWQADGFDFTVAVNVSPRCLVDREVTDGLFTLFDRHGVAPSTLVLEITEEALAAGSDASLATLTALHASGIRFSVDDFGTGYSSLSRLGRLPVDELKIDRSFVAEMLEARDGAVLVRSMIELGHNLGLTVVAEGIEDQATADALAAEGCDTAQGFYLGRPMTVAALSAWMESRRAGAGTPRVPAQRSPSGPLQAPTA